MLSLENNALQSPMPRYLLDQPTSQLILMTNNSFACPLVRALLFPNKKRVNLLTSVVYHQSPNGAVTLHLATDNALHVVRYSSDGLDINWSEADSEATIFQRC